MESKRVIRLATTAVFGLVALAPTAASARSLSYYNVPIYGNGSWVDQHTPRTTPDGRGGPGGGHRGPGQHANPPHGLQGIRCVVC
jgi:hypothetical protein